LDISSWTNYEPILVTWYFSKWSIKAFITMPPRLSKIDSRIESDGKSL